MRPCIHPLIHNHMPPNLIPYGRRRGALTKQTHTLDHSCCLPHTHHHTHHTTTHTHTHTHTPTPTHQANHTHTPTHTHTHTHPHTHTHTHTANTHAHTQTYTPNTHTLKTQTHTIIPPPLIKSLTNVRLRTSSFPPLYYIQCMFL